MPKKQGATKKRATTQKHGMVVIASGDRPVEEVAGDLKKAGFEVDQVLSALGQVTGHAAPKLKQRLRAIHGVADVSDTHEDFNIGPPGAPVS
jgi:hypothetical protein